MFVLKTFIKNTLINNLAPIIKTTSFLELQQRFAHSKRSIYPKTPDLIYVPQVLRWIRNKWKFRALKKCWDPDFSEGAFIYGTTRAVCKITDIINRGQPEELENLLTFSAKVKLVDYMKRRLSKVQKEIITLKPEDIKILVPLNVALVEAGNKKNCRISMRVLGLKWHEHNGNVLKLVLVALQTEFLRDYTQRNSEWTISAFDILECGMLAQIPGQRKPI
ncbi:unnamed protein product [Ceutorhynchus assimilis]|uniref:Uncharacterized protein n=1 Tax=Ceutorhynchus assimilis TaxID=467358 RepID=A0A9N9QAC1_9CUCU|nr:unnamed protein product [Ceutorhynchus assimilis]